MALPPKTNMIPFGSIRREHRDSGQSPDLFDFGALGYGDPIIAVKEGWSGFVVPALYIGTTADAAIWRIVSTTSHLIVEKKTGGVWAAAGTLA